MPIKVENKGRYPKDWKQIADRIRQRAGNKCEVCGLANGAEGWRAKDGTFCSVDEWSNSHLSTTRETEIGRKIEQNIEPIKIVLTVAHLDHTPENCSDENLKAMCQRCHNRYDSVHRQTNAKKTRAEKRKPQLSLFD